MEMRKRLSRYLSIVFLFLLASSLVIGAEVRVARAEFYVTIWAWDSVHGWLSEPITMDYVPTGFNTPHTFTVMDNLAHSFMVPVTDGYGTRFSKWDRGDISTVIWVSGGGTYTAQYNATPYDATIWAWEDSVHGWLSEPITMDDVPTGFNTPHTFTGLQGMHSFIARDTNDYGGSFKIWNPPPTLPTSPTSSTIFICSSGTYTAEYSGLPYDVTIWGWDSVQGWLNNLPITMDGSPTGFTTPHTFTGLTGVGHVFTVPDTNSYNTRFTRWSSGEESTSLTVDTGGTFAAQYYVWWIETVDASSSDVGRGSSIALDSYGRPHIAYVDYSSNSLKYASWTGSAGGEGIWDIETVDSGGSIRYNTASLALDSSDVPHISYSKDYLIYATKVGSSWPKQTVDSANSEDGRWCSMKLDSDGYPHICYVAGVGDLYVKYAAWTGAAWSIEYVASTGYTGFKFTSLALDSLDKPHACWFFSGGGFTSPTVFYSNKTGDAWGSPVAVAAGLTSVSGYCSIAVDSLDHACISYYDEYNDGSVNTGTLKFAKWTGATWSIETVQAPGFNKDWVGQYTCLVTDYMGRPHISYYESWWTGSTTAGVLKYAWWTGSSWSIETADPTWNVGKWSSVAVDASGKVHISYYDDTNKCLKYARRSPLPNFDSHEYFFQVFYDALDTDGDGQDNAIKATMDVDSAYGGTQKVTVLTVLRDPWDNNCAYNYTTWPITDFLVEYGEATVYAPPGSISGLYDVILILYDNGNHIEDQIVEESVAYLYPSVATYSATIWGWDVEGWIEVPITMDGSPTGFSTPHTFSGLTGTHTFTVPDLDPLGYGFTSWNTGEPSTTITVSSEGTYTAQYSIPPTLALEGVQAWYWTDNTEIRSVAEGNVDGDGSVEIVTGGYFDDGTRYVAQLCVWNGATLALEKVQTWYWTGNTYINSVAIGCVDADGKAEIVTGGWYDDGSRLVAQLCVWDGATLTLESVQTWYLISDTNIVSVAVGCVDDDGKAEIVTGGSYFDSFALRSVAQLCVWDGASLALENVKAWYWTSDTFIQSVAIGDLDGSENEIVTGGAHYDGSRLVAQLCVWDGSALTLKSVKTWYWITETLIFSVAVDCVDADGETEIVTGGYYSDWTRDIAQLCVWDGATLALESVKTWYWMSNTDIMSVAVGCVDEDGKAEIVTGGFYYDGSHHTAQTCVWDGATLALESVKSWYWTNATVVNSVVVGCVDADGRAEIVAGCYYYDYTRNIAQLCVWTK